MKTLKLTPAEVQILLHRLKASGERMPRLERKLEALIEPRPISKALETAKASDLFAQGRMIILGQHVDGPEAA